MRLKNKVAIVAGGARDIGKEVSLKLASEGAKVVVNYFSSEEKAKDLAKEIVDQGGEAIAVRADVTKNNQALALVDACKKAFGNEVKTAF